MKEGKRSKCTINNTLCTFVLSDMTNYRTKSLSSLLFREFKTGLQFISPQF